MSESKGKVAFRRVRGRIVPIRLKEHIVEGAKGGGLAVAGVTASVATGLASAELDKRHHVLKSFAINMGLRSDRLWKAEKGFRAAKVAQKAEAIFARADRAAAVSTKVSKAGFGISAAMIGLGLNQILKQTPLRDNAEARASAS